MSKEKVSSQSRSLNKLNITQIIPLVMFKRDSDSNRDSSDLFWDRVVFIYSEPSIMKFGKQLYLIKILQLSLYDIRCFMDSILINGYLYE